MPKPEVTIVRVPFYYAPSQDAPDGAASEVAPPPKGTFVTNVFVEVIAFDARFFWIHISEDALASSSRPAPSPLGCCATSIALPPAETREQPVANYASLPVSSTLWLDGESSVHGGGGAGMDAVQATTTTIQAAFATSLSQKLSRRVQKQFCRGCVVHASCGVSGEQAQSLLGTDSGGGFAVTAAFGALVFREALSVIEETIKKHIDSEMRA